MGNYKNRREKLMVIIWDRHPSVTRVFKLSLCLPHLTGVFKKVARNASVYLKEIYHKRLEGCWGRTGWKKR